MSDDLVEQIARRFSHVTFANPRYPDKVYDMDWELYVAAARECLRQMEWAADRAWKQGRTSGFNAATYWPNDTPRDEPYSGVRTLPPNEWRPR